MSRVLAWWVSMAVLVLTLLRVWHMVLYKIQLRPPGLAWWVLLAWICIGVARQMECAVPAGNTAGEPPRLWRDRSDGFWVMLAVFTVLLGLFHTGFARAASDGRGYFAQAKSIAIDGNLDFANNIATFRARVQDANFPIGTALLWTPFMWLAHAWSGMLNLLGDDRVRDGFANPYQRAVGLGTLIYGCAAFFMIFRAVRGEFDRATTTVAVLAIALATPALWYLTVDNSMSHGVSLFAATTFMFVWLNIRQVSTPVHWGLLAAAGVVMVLVRPQNAIFVMVPVVDATFRAWRRGATAPRRQRLTPRRLAKVGLGVALGAIVALSAAALMRDYVAAQHLFAVFNPLLVLFSPQHGLVSSSPILALAIVGLPLMLRHDRGLALGLSAAVVLQVVANASSPGWDGGASFGARRFVACAMPFAFGLAACVHEMRRRPLVPITMIVGSIVVVNLLLVAEVRKGAITLSDPVPFSRMMDAVSERIGNPFALPGAIAFAYRHGVPVSFLDQAPARRYNVLTVNVGNDDDRRFLTGALFEPESDGARTFRWASAPEVVLLTRLRAESYGLSFVAAPFVDPNSGPQTVQVWVGDRLLETFSLAPGFARYEVDAASPIVPGSDWVRIAFRFRYAVSPSELGLSDDPRRLAVQFDSIRLEPR